MTAENKKVLAAIAIIGASILGALAMETSSSDSSSVVSYELYYECLNSHPSGQQGRCLKHDPDIAAWVKENR